MKSTDIAMIVLVAAVSVGVAFGLVSAIPALKVSNEPVKVKTIEAYSSEIIAPNEAIFNKDAINPTVDVTIGDSQPTDK